jgi:hypothetical protein
MKNIIGKSCLKKYTNWIKYVLLINKYFYPLLMKLKKYALFFQNKVKF